MEKTVMIKCLLPRSTDILLKTTHHMLGIYQLIQTQKQHIRHIKKKSHM